MPSLPHETIVELFRRRRVLAPEVLHHLLGVDLPPHTDLRIEDSALNELVPTEYRADLVLLLEDEKPVFGIVVEVQLGTDPRKRFSWPVYAATVRARFGCPCVVLVIATDLQVARWAAEPIELGGASVFRALVLGPRAIPRVTSVDVARASPEIAVLSAIAHGNAPDGLEVVMAALGGTVHLDGGHTVGYHDLIIASVSEALRKELKVMFVGGKYEIQTDFIREYFEKGDLSARADMVLRALDLKGFEVSKVIREQVLGCGDVAQLLEWHARAIRATSIEDVFDG